MGKAPSGILKVFLVLPEGEENFIRSPVGDLKSFIARWSGRTLVLLEYKRGSEKNMYFSTARSPRAGELLSSSK